MKYLYSRAIKSTETSLELGESALDSGKLKCTVCGKQYKSAHHFDNHVSREHNEHRLTALPKVNPFKRPGSAGLLSKINFTNLDEPVKRSALTNLRKPVKRPRKFIFDKNLLVKPKEISTLSYKHCLPSTSKIKSSQLTAPSLKSPTKPAPLEPLPLKPPPLQQPPLQPPPSKPPPSKPVCDLTESSPFRIPSRVTVKKSLSLCHHGEIKPVILTMEDGEQYHFLTCQENLDAVITEQPTAGSWGLPIQGSSL